MHVGTFLISVQESIITPVEGDNRKDAGMPSRCSTRLTAMPASYTSI